MDSTKDEVSFEFPGLRVYKDGRVERLSRTDFVPPSLDLSTGVSSKDVVIEPSTGLSARLFLPKVTDPQKKLPLLIYYHGGAFIIESPFSPIYHPYLNSLVSEANVVAVSVDYRKAPEQPVPICYEDSWTALQWVASQAGEEEWLKNYADFDRVFMAGDSAGANIVHNMAIRAGVFGLKGLKMNGIVLVHPYFNGAEPLESEVDNPLMKFGGMIWKVVCPSSNGLDDPFVNPAKDPNLARLGCKKVLVCVAEKDALGDRGKLYHQTLVKSDWDGVVELTAAPGEEHVFHLINPSCEHAKDLMKRLVSFMNTSD